MTVNAAGEPAQLPPETRNRVLEAALRLRRPGHPVPEPPSLTPAEVFAESADRLHQLLLQLSPAEWRLGAIRDLDVQGLIGHLIGVEEHLHRALDGTASELAEADHVATTQPAAERQSGLEPTLTRQEWRSAVDGTLLRLGRVPDDYLIELYGIRLPVGPFLTTRAFELWTHESDIRQVTGRDPVDPSPGAVHRMAELACALLPPSADRLGSPPGAVRLVLTGPGGGTFDLRFGRAAATAAGTRIVADAVLFCRLAANRMTAEAIASEITGDGALAASALRAARALALD